MIFNHLHISYRHLIPLAMAFLLTMFGRVPASAQQQASQTPDIQQMQKRLEQLEKELRELKQQMSSAAALSKEAIPGPSVDVTAETRQAEEKSEQAAPSTSLEIYGYAMLDSGYDFKTNDPNWFDVVRPTKLPAAAGDFAPDGKTYF